MHSLTVRNYPLLSIHRPKPVVSEGSPLLGYVSFFRVFTQLTCSCPSLRTCFCCPRARIRVSFVGYARPHGCMRWLERFTLSSGVVSFSLKEAENPSRVFCQKSRMEKGKRKKEKNAPVFIAYHFLKIIFSPQLTKMQAQNSTGFPSAPRAEFCRRGAFLPRQISTPLLFSSSLKLSSVSHIERQTMTKQRKPKTRHVFPLFPLHL